jgi:hypothetical protein
VLDGRHAAGQARTKRAAEKLAAERLLTILHADLDKRGK